jgi:hypothetical protein
MRYDVEGGREQRASETRVEVSKASYVSYAWLDFVLLETLEQDRISLWTIKFVSRPR